MRPPLGSPTAVHADVHVILFHPSYDGQSNQTMYLGGDGGVFRTDNALASVATGDRSPCNFTNTRVNWTKLDHNYATLQFYHGAVYPGGHFYFGGAQDNGTTRGSDTGGPQNWNFIQGGDGGYNAIDPTNVNRLFVEFQRATVLNWFRRSLDGGKTLSVAMTGINEPADLSHFLFATPFRMDPNEPNRLYFAGQTLWRTNDGAAHWSAASTPAPSGIISAIGISPLDSNRVFAGTTTGFIHRSVAALSADASTIWSRVQPRAGSVSSFAFDPMNPNLAYATYSGFNGAGANVGHVFMTPDGGLTWTPIDGVGDTSIPDIPVHSIVVNPLSPSTLYLGTDLGVFVSLDGGASWAREDTQFPTTEVASMTIETGNGAPVLYAFTHGRGLWRVRLTGDGPCSYKLSAQGTAIAFGETRPLHIDTGQNCVWSAVSSSFASLDPPATGSGPGDLGVTFPLNQGIARVATIQVADQTIQMTQDRPFVPSTTWDDVSSPFAVQQLPFVGVQDTRGATSSATDPTHSCTGNAAGSKTVWLTYTATFTGTLHIGASGARYDNGQNYGIVISAYQSMAKSPAAGLELVCSAGPPLERQLS